MHWEVEYKNKKIFGLCPIVSVRLWFRPWLLWPIF